MVGSEIVVVYCLVLSGYLFASGPHLSGIVCNNSCELNIFISLLNCSLDYIFFCKRSNQ